MNFYELLMNGYVIRIEDNVGGYCDPAEFWMENGQLNGWCPAVGIFASTLSAEELNDNFKTFLKQGFDVIIKHKNNFKRR